MIHNRIALFTVVREKGVLAGNRCRIPLQHLSTLLFLFFYLNFYIFFSSLLLASAILFTVLLTKIKNNRKMISLSQPEIC